MGESKDKTFAENLSKELKTGKTEASQEKTAGRELDVFISYSSLNKNVADAVVSDFEQHGIRCWYAPRDIMPGQEWVTAIHEAINSSRLFVLIYTDSSNESKQVANEVALAFNSGKTLIPFRLSDAEMSTELEYYLTRVHWLDAVKPPLMQSIESLRIYSEKILKGEEVKEAKVRNANSSAAKDVKMPVWASVSIIILALGLLAIAIFLFVNRDSDKDTKEDNTEITDEITADPLPTEALSEINKPTEQIPVETGTPEPTVETEDYFKIAYGIQMDDEAENRYELAYEEYMKTGVNETTTEEIAQAMYELAGRFSREDGVELNYEKAIKLYEKAILSGNVPALNSMGNLYMNGDGVEEDPKKAEEYYIRAAEFGDINAMMNLGSYYENLYFENDDESCASEALKYYKMAEENGYSSAKGKYESLYEKVTS